MSFPRAKRFNIPKDYTPSPAEYNVDLKDKPKCGVISQSDRFSEATKSPTVSEHGSIKSVPCFRTPTLIRKKKPLIKTPSSASKQSKLSKVKGLFSSTNSSTNNNNHDNETLREIMVECSNKDIFIAELNEQIEDMKTKMATLETQKLELDSQKKYLEDQINILNNEHDTKICAIISKHEDEMTAINNKIIDLNEELIIVRKEMEDLKYDNKKEMDNLLKNIDKFQILYKEAMKNYENELKTKNDQLNQKERELKLLEDSCIDIQRKHAQDIERIQKEHLLDVQDIEFEFLKSITEMQNTVEKEKRECDRKIKELKADFQKEHKNIILESEAKIKQVQENFKEVNVLSEIQMKEKCLELEQTWKLKLEEQEKESNAILKECQAISEYNIIQSELEKNDMKAKLIETEKELVNFKAMQEVVLEKYTNIQLSYKDLQSKLKQTVTEMIETKDKLLKELASQKTDYNKLLAEKRTYEITINTSQVTINVLKNRLINSDKDVEQLKNEIQACEVKLLEYEEKINQVTGELERLHLANEELDMQNESTLKFAESEVQQVKKDLLNKIEAFKVNSQEKINELKNHLEKKEHEYNEILNQLHDQQKLTSNAQFLINEVSNELERLESLNVNLNIQNDQLQKENLMFEQRFTEYKESKEKELLSYKDKVVELEDTVVSKDHEINFISDLVEELQEKNTTYYHYYECFNNYVAEHENEVKEANEIRRKYIDQSGKNDELLEQIEMLKMENMMQKQKIEEQESLIGPFREQLEKYELQEKALMSEKDYMESEAKQLRLKYAEILGHQNHKQKIKHLVDLKTKNEELAKSKLDLEGKLRSHTKTIEKLKKENLDLKKSIKKIKPTATDKENISSPNRSLNTSSRIESPGPLRERN